MSAVHIPFKTDSRSNFKWLIKDLTSLTSSQFYLREPYEFKMQLLH